MEGLPLLERDQTLARLGRLVEAAEQRRGSLVLLGGEAGVGKSALLRRFTAEIGGRARVLIGTCDDLSTPRPLGPIVDVADRLGADFGQLLAVDHHRSLLLQAVLAALDRAPRALPTVLVVEDAHWADEATLDLLRYRGRRIEDRRALVVVTYRDDEIGPHHPFRRVLGDLATASGVHRLVLAPLSAEAVTTLACGSGIDPLRLYHETGGNPFYVREILAAPGPGIPATVRDAVLARAYRLGPAAWEVLAAAAVLGRPADLETLLAVAGQEIAAVEECLAVGLLHAEGSTLAYRHDLSRQAVFGSLSPPRRADFHARALRTLAGGSAPRDPAHLAHHAEGAADGAAVLRYAPEAARRAAMFGAHREAAAQYARAQRRAESLSLAARARLHEAYSYECYLTAQLDEAMTARTQALRLWREIGDRRKVGENHSHLALLEWAATRFDAAEQEVNAAIAILEPLPPGPALAMAYATAARLRGTLVDDAAAIALGTRAVTLAETLGVTETQVDALITVGSARLAGGADAGRDLLHRSIALATAAGLDDLIARAHANLGFGYEDLLHFATAANHFADGVAFCAERDLDHARFHLSAWLAHSWMYLGQWDAAAALAQEVLAGPDRAGVTRFPALLVASVIGVRRGLPYVSALLDEAQALAEGSGSLHRLGPIHVARAEAAWLAGDQQRAAGEVAAVYDLALNRNHPRYLGELAYWSWKTGGLAVSPAGIAASYARQIEGDWRTAAAIWDDLGCPYEAARSRLEGDDPVEVRAALVQFDSLGARPAIGLATRRLHDLGASIPRGPRSSTRGNAAGLTQREMEVLRLLVEDASNQQIADQLYLSVRTVEHHVAAVLAKLAITRRTDVKRVASRRGLLPQSR